MITYVSYRTFYFNIEKFQQIKKKVVRVNACTNLSIISRQLYYRNMNLGW